MAKEYFQKLENLIEKINLESDVDSRTKVKHFFSGAALYVNGTMCASWSPAGLAFKLPEHETNDLIARGKASPLKYFAKGNIKKGYALFEKPNESAVNKWKSYFIKATQQAGVQAGLNV